MTAGRAAMAKKNKKKQKAKAAQPNNYSNNVSTDRPDDEEDEDGHPLSTGHNGGYVNTGLSPELESVHLSTTASLNPKNPNNHINADLNQLMATAHHLYQQSSLGNLRESDLAGIGSPEEYWASLPDKVQNIIRHASQDLTGSPAERQEALTAIMNTMIRSGPPPLPLEAKALLGLDFAQDLTKMGLPNPLHRQTAEYARDYVNGVEEDEYGTEDDEYYPEGQNEPPPTSGIGMGGKKKNKKKKKKSLGPQQADPPLPPVEPATPMPQTHPPPPIPRTRQASQPQPQPPQQPVVTRPPPSSRAAGKQPMSYPASTNPPPRSQTQSTTNTNSSIKAARGKPGYTAAHRGAAKAPATTAQPKNKIWSTNSAEERERIKEFWLGLSEEERRELVKVEKEAVLRKMKEQQKHSCSCAVCGRKRVNDGFSTRHAIEEELEVLYDAYYDELESYASYQQKYLASGGKGMQPPPPGPFPGSVEFGQDGSITYHHTHSGHRRPDVVTHAKYSGKRAMPNTVYRKGTNEFDDEGYEEEEYDEEEEEEEEGEEEEEEEEDEEDEGDDNAKRRGPVKKRAAKGGGGVNKELFTIGSNLTAAGPGNILTVADDLLKNDGQKFLEMMESLAERRMLREEEAALSVELTTEDEEEQEEDEEDEEEEEEEDEEDEILTEEQRMEEGKRMFSIFAARMFEQRVLQAYREKVAQERQLQLLRELEDESKAEKDKEAKKQKESQKKKEKKKLQKQQKDEEKAHKAAEKAAEEATLRLKQEALEEEAKKKKEEERIRREVQREAQRKAQEEERSRREEEKRKRQEAERERQVEIERKRKEKEEKARQDRKEREERERKAREEKEAKAATLKKEREQREQAEKEEREKKAAKENEERLEREAKEKLAAQQAKERQTSRQPVVGRGTPAASSSTKSAPAPAAGSSSKANSNHPSAPKKILTKPVLPTSQPVSSAPTPATPLRSVPPVVAPRPGPSSQPNLASFPSPIATPQTPVNIGLGYPGANHNSVVNGSLPTSPRQLKAFVHPTPQGLPPTPFAGFSSPIGANATPIPPGLGPSAVPRGFGMGSAPYDSSFPPRPPPLVPPPIIPIGKLPGQSPIPTPASPSASFGNPSHIGHPGGHQRRASVQEGQFGAVQRPMASIAPIARPSVVGSSNTDEQLSASGSSTRMPPSPVTKEEVLGSSALRADDDDIIVPSGSGRRIGGVAPGSQPPLPPGAGAGAGAGAGRGSGFANSPWSATAPQPAGFPIPRPPSAPTWAQAPPGVPVPPSQGWTMYQGQWYRPHEPSPPHTGA